jgi:hypothetical protein
MTIQNILPDPRTGLNRELKFKSFSVDHVAKKITINWRLAVYRLDGTESAESIDLAQVADNGVSVNIELFALTGTVQLLTMEELADSPVPPECMGEYDFWWYVADNFHPDIRQQIMDAGTQFAIRRGYLNGL